MLKRSLMVLVTGLILLAAVSLAGCASQPEESPLPPVQDEQPAAEEPVVEEPAAAEGPGQTEDVTELVIEDLVVGEGAEAKTGDSVTVHYTGWLADGTKFDSSLDSGQPFTFVPGEQLVIAGWEEGVPGMKVGGTRRLFIPPDMAYGEQGRPPVIPPNATLVFDVELVAVN